MRLLLSKILKHAGAILEARTRHTLKEAIVDLAPAIVDKICDRLKDSPSKNEKKQNKADLKLEKKTDVNSDSVSVPLKSVEIDAKKKVLNIKPKEEQDKQTKIV